MMRLVKEEIIARLRLAQDEFINYCETISDDDFFFQPTGKWSIAQNVNHLIVSASTTRLAFILPKLVLRLYTGRPNRPSRDYDELVKKYKAKLEQGGKASGIYIPKTILPKTWTSNTPTFISTWAAAAPSSRFSPKVASATKNRSTLVRSGC